MAISFTKFEGAVPARYDKYMGPIFFEPYAIELADRISRGNHQSVLEIACGTGRVTRHLRSALPTNAKLFATDINPGMIQVASKNLADKSIRFQVADAQDLPFDENSFDAVVCQFGYMFVPEKMQAFKEAFRVLRRPGILLFNTWDSIENNPLSDTVSQLLQEHFPGTRAASFYNIPFSMYDRRQIEHLLKEAGFKNINIDLVTKTATAESAEQAAKALITGTPVYDFVMEIDPSAPDKLVEIATPEIVKRYGDQPSVSDMNALVVEGWK